MAKISNTSAYPQIVNPDVNDYVILTDKENQLKTKSCTLGDLQGLFGSTMLVAHVTVNSASLLTLQATDVILIAAPGVNKALDVISITGYIDAGSQAYNFNDEGKFNINSVELSALEYAGFLNQSSDKVYKSNIQNGQTGTLIEPNSPLVLGTSGTVSQGNGTVYLNILYRVLDVGPNF